MTGAYTKWRRITWNKSKRINFIVKLQNYYVFLVNRLDSRQLSWYYWVSVYHLLSLLFFSILPIFCRYFFISIIRLLLAVTISRAQCFVHRLVSMSFMHVWCCTIHCDHSAHHLWIKLVIFAFSRLSNLLAFGSITQMWSAYRRCCSSTHYAIINIIDEIPTLNSFPNGIRTWLVE